jgi:protein SPT2
MNSVAPPPPPSSAPVKPSAPVNNAKKPKQPLRQSEQESQPAQQRINAKTAKPIEHESSRRTDRNQPQAQLKRPFVAHDRTHLPREAEKKPKPSSSKFATRELDRQASRHPPPPPIISKNARNEATSRENRMHPKPIRESRPPDTSYSTSAKPKGRQIIISDEEDEYDSEMDDFIDDSDVNPSQISDLIRNITGYDKHKYKDTSDDECMESNVWQQMREEQKSLRIGIQEDLEDIRREEEEKKRKALMKKKKFK